MKTTKKILSIVLAVMLLVGSIVVGVSADTTFVYEQAGSKLTYTAEASKAANEDGVIEVKPGETLTVSVYAQANYYLGTTGAEIFCWTAGFFDSFEDTEVTIHNYVNNYTPNKKVIPSTAATQLGTGYKDGTHEGYFHGRLYTTDCTSPYDASEKTLGYVFTFTVPADATVGATGEFRMPETCSATVAATSRMRQIYAAVNNSATAYGSSSLASLYPETIDLTGAILNFVVVGEDVLCDYAALDAAIAAYEAKVADKDLYENWADYEAAYTAAKAVARNLVVDDEGVNQKTIDDAAAALNAVVLVYKAADYSAVEAAKATIPADLSIYTAASVKAVEDAVAAVVEGYDITKQAEVDAFAAAITDAVAKLAPLGTCDYTALDAAIAAYEAKVADKDLYVNWADYEAAYNAAKAVERDMLADEDGANQATIDDAAEDLNAVVLEYKPADYSAVEAAEATIPADLSIYTSASVKAVEDAVDAVVYDLDITKQAEVDAYAAAITDAVAKLVPLGECDYTALDAAIAEYDGLNKADYTPASWTAADVDALYAAAKAVERDMLADEAGANQAAIDAAATALADAIDALVPVADKAALVAAIARASALTEDTYTPASWTAADLATVLAAANTVNADANASQDAVDAQVAAIEAAEAKLVVKADKTALAKAIAAAQALVEDDYTPDSWAAADMAAAIAAAQVVYDDGNADEAAIAAAIEALEAEAAKLVKKADKSALLAAINTLPAYAQEDADSASWAAYEAELVAANEVYDDANATQDAVDAAEASLLAAIAAVKAKVYCDYTALDAAIAAYEAKVADADLYANWSGYQAAYDVAKNVARGLEYTEADQKVIDDAAAALSGYVLEYKPADYSAVEAAEATIPADLSIYTAASVKAVTDAVDAVVYDLDITKQAEVDAYAAAIVDAVAKLAPLGACDYTALDAAIAAYEAKVADKDLYVNWADYEAAYNVAKAVERDMLADEDGANQATIDDAAEDLNAVVLEYKPADYSAVEAAEATIPADLSIYTAASVKAVEDAVDAVVYDLDITKQAEVDAYAAAIADAVAKLVPLGECDYTALDAALALVPAETADAYTAASWDAYAAAKAAAEAVERGMLNDEAGKNQAAIDAAADELVAKYKELELLPTEAIVMNVTPKQEFFSAGDTVEFDFLCRQTNVSKLQIVFSSGTTSTYARNHTSVTNITDNGDGTETWTIAVKVFADTIEAKAKGKLGKVWEKNAYPFTIQAKSGEDIEVKSVAITKADGTVVTEFTTKDTVTVTIVTGPDTLRMRLVTPAGSTSTYTRDKAVQDENGNWVWSIVTRKTTAKEYIYNIYTAGKNNKPVDEGTDLVYTVTTPAPAYVGPSTGNTADAVISATVASARLFVGDTQTVTVVTDKAALGVSIVDADGDVHWHTKDTSVAVDNGDGTLTWTFTVSCAYAATFTFDVEALYGNQWMNNGTTITYRVLY